MKTVKLAIYSDFICPWCYLGKSRIERIQERLDGEIKLDIELRPYVLYPLIPKGGAPKSAFAKKTKPGMGRSLRQVAAEEGVNLNYKDIERIPYSLEAHRLLTLVDKDKQFDLAKKIFYAYFEEAKDIEDLDLLAALAKSVGMDKELIGRFMFTDIGEEETLAAIEEAKNAFVTVVPSIQFDGKIIMSGLQPVEVWERYIRKAAAIQQPS